MARLAIAAWALAVAAATSASAAPAGSPQVHPSLWPAAHSPAALTDARTEAFVATLMADMSVEEKVGQLIQADMTSIKPEELRTYPLGSILAGGSSGPGGDDRAPASAWLDVIRAYRTVSLEQRPGHSPVPIIFGLDAVHGNNNIIGATIFPHNVGLGATHDPELIRRIGQVTAAETRPVGALWTFGPTVAVPRDDRWGRSYEGYSEDPALVRAYAAAMVEGLQGPLGPAAIGPDHVIATPKHFLGDGGTAGGKDQGDNPDSEADLVRLHAQGYPAAVNAGALTVMGSYSSWQGVKNHGNKGLLTDALKGRMGFNGFIVGDWNGHAQVPGCTPISCAAAINAGLDMFMAPDSWKGLYTNTLAQVRSGEIPMARLDDAVRRILRVKVKAGAFGSPSPLEGRLELIGSADHREVAREAVRKSLVLLKNNGVLPIRASAHVLVAGDGADNIGKQSGGWTISWQGTGNRNSDFPHGQSVYAGIRDALSASGGAAELSPTGEFKQKPDVAVVVFGEDPYAEFLGDRPSIAYRPGDTRDTDLMRKLKGQGIPVVAVFLSGRPLWTNPQINAADAFVAAWLPGSEGGGVADVLVGDAAGKARHDFSGKLAFSWPKRPDQAVLNRGDPGYDPLFAYGYGASYAAKADPGRLQEDFPGLAALASTDVYFASGSIPPPWSLTQLNARSEAIGEGRTFFWAKAGEVRFGGPAVDISRQTTGDMALAVKVKRGEGAVQLFMGCDDACRGAIDLTPLLAQAPAGEWRTLKIKLSCFAARGADMKKISVPLGLAASGPASITIADARLVTNEGDAICPGAAP
jgi:beta-glucosidase